MKIFKKILPLTKKLIKNRKLKRIFILSIQKRCQRTKNIQRILLHFWMNFFFKYESILFVFSTRMPLHFLLIFTNQFMEKKEDILMGNR